MPAEPEPTKPVSDGQSKIVGGAIGLLIVWFFEIPAEPGSAITILCGFVTDQLMALANFGISVLSRRMGWGEHGEQP